MRILVTGARGFIGQHMVRTLVEEGHDVVAIDKKGEQQKNKYKQYRADIREKEQVRWIFKIHQPEAVIHLAAQTSVPYSMQFPVDDSEHNIKGTLNVLALCKEFEVKHFLFASSAAVYGNPQQSIIQEEHPLCPVSFYGISKSTSEQHIQTFCSMHKMTFHIFRYANVYGSGQESESVISQFVRNVKQGKVLEIQGDGNQTRDFIHVHDVVRANIQALSVSQSGIYNVSSQTEVSINELLQHIMEVAETKVPVVYRESRIGDIQKSCLSNQKAKQQLSWQPQFNLQQGLIETMTQEGL